MASKTRRKVWLLDKYPPKFIDKGPHGFQGSLPPTGEKVLLQLIAYIKFNMENSRRQSSQSEAIASVAEDLASWWVRTGIELKSQSGLLKMLKGLHQQYNKLRKNKSRNSSKDIAARKKFIDGLKSTFWIVQPKAEKRLELNASKNKVDDRDREDWKYLNSIKGENRSGVLGSVDKVLAKRKKRKQNVINSLNQNKERVNSYEKTHYINDEGMCGLTDSNDKGAAVPMITGDEAGAGERSSSSQSDSEWINDEGRRNTPKEYAIPEAAYLIADKYHMSNRELTELAAVFLSTKYATDITSEILSPTTTRRKRSKIRRMKAEEITKHAIGDQQVKFYTLHWDSKKIKSLNHVGDDKERIAVVLTGKYSLHLLRLYGSMGPDFIHIDIFMINLLENTYNNLLPHRV